MIENKTHCVHLIDTNRLITNFISISKRIIILIQLLNIDFIIFHRQFEVYTYLLIKKSRFCILSNTFLFYFMSIRKLGHCKKMTGQFWKLLQNVHSLYVFWSLYIFTENYETLIILKALKPLYMYNNFTA